MRMIHIKQRFPNFFSGFTPEEADIETLDQLHGIGFIHRWMSNPNFARLSYGRSRSPQQILMVEMKNGEFWAIAFVKGDLSTIGLSQWKDRV